MGIIPRPRPSQCHWIYSIIRVLGRSALGRQAVTAGGSLRSVRHVNPRPALTDGSTSADSSARERRQFNGAECRAGRPAGRRVTDIVRQSRREGRRACWQPVVGDEIANPRGAEISNSRRSTPIFYLPRTT